MCAWHQIFIQTYPDCEFFVWRKDFSNCSIMKAYSHTLSTTNHFTGEATCNVTFLDPKSKKPISYAKASATHQAAPASRSTLTTIQLEWTWKVSTMWHLRKTARTSVSRTLTASSGPTSPRVTLLGPALVGLRTTFCPNRRTISGSSPAQGSARTCHKSCQDYKVTVLVA